MRWGIFLQRRGRKVKLGARCRRPHWPAWPHSPAWKEGYFNLTELDARLTSHTAATATIVEHEGNLAGSNSEATLRKVHGRWVVIDFKVWAVA